jgi:hypothetical protein
MTKDKDSLHWVAFVVFLLGFMAFMSGLSQLFNEGSSIVVAGGTMALLLGLGNELRLYTPGEATNRWWTNTRWGLIFGGLAILLGLVLAAQEGDTTDCPKNAKTVQHFTGVK